MSLLERLETEQGAYDAFFVECGCDYARAAHRLVVEKLKAWHVSVKPIPTPAELFAAARDIGSRVTIYHDHLPSKPDLLASAHRQGLEVLPGHQPWHKGE